MKDKTERFQEAFEYLRAQGKVHTQIEAAAKMGATSQNFSAAMNGNLKLLTDKFLKRFNAAFDGVFNIKWLLTGEGEMLADEPSQAFPQEESEMSCLLSLLKKKDEQIDRLITLLERETERTKIIVSRAG